MLEKTAKTTTYESYRNSEISWLEEIPEHWELKRFKHIFKEKKITHNVALNCGSISFGKVVYKDDKKVPVSTKKSYQVLNKGEFLINPLNLNYDLISLRIGLSDKDVVVSSGYIIVQNHTELCKDYYKWLLHIFDIAFMKTLGSGVRQTLSFTHVKNSELVFPPLQEQTAIATFLDNKTTKIDEAISIKEQQIELLKERKQILIHKAVTQGLNPEVKLIKSGVAWISDIPEHWDLTRLGTRFKERKTKVSDKDFPPLSVTKNGTVPQLANAAKSNDGDNRKLVKKGDFVINSRSDRKGSSGIAYQDGSVSLIYIVMEPLNIHPIYCNYLLKSYNFTEEFYRMGHGIVADLWTTRYDEMKIIMVGIPSLPEQKAIAEFIETVTNKIETAISLKQQEIAKLKEYKSSLINAVVTGKVKVF